MGSDAAELVNKVKDQVRKRQKRMFEHCRVMWRTFNNTGNVHAYDVKCGDIHGKEFLNYSKCCQESWKSHLETDVWCHSALSQQSGRNQWPGQNSVWEEFLDTSVINWWWNSHQIFNAHKSLYSQILCCVLERPIKTRNPTKHGKKRIEGTTTDQSYRDYDGINGEPTEFVWNIFPGFTTLQLCGKVNDLLSDLGEISNKFTGRILFMSMFNDISCDGKGNKDGCLANAGVVKVLAKKIWCWTMVTYKTRFWKEDFILWKRIAHKDFLGSYRGQDAVGIRRKWMSSFFVQQLHCPGVSSKAKDTENCRYILLRINRQLKQIFA